MTADADKTGQVDHLLSTPNLAGALESEQFRRFLDQIPIAIIVAELKDEERIVYVNPEWEELSGQAVTELEGQSWTALRGEDCSDPTRKLGDAVTEMEDRVGAFRIERAGREPAVVDAYSNLIEDDHGKAAFRLAALVDVQTHAQEQRQELESRILEKDTLLKELQHRVRNNLQMITALIRLEAHQAGGVQDERLARVAGRIDALKYLYQSLSEDAQGDAIDLGIYLSQIASAVMRAHATEGVRLDLKVDSFPVSVNVAMPAGLVVNELLTNALKHAFADRDGGEITLHSLVDDTGCRVVVADNGAGLPEGMEWPQPGKLGALMVKSLQTNAKATFELESGPNGGTRAIICFARKAAAPGNA
ncbi:sensor histidine kinase [Geminicoccus sp.]|uniref:sensor histidine kinase n=1 Tax=Geminicoccus sp. TaxID=2024832 RepID=UPI002E32CBEC|nr:histidine kinase dimerization/phosphoacceptor domain -containing protein [Geminicoccus sp.]